MDREYIKKAESDYHDAIRRAYKEKDMNWIHHLWTQLGIYYRDIHTDHSSSHIFASIKSFESALNCLLRNYSGENESHYTAIGGCFLQLARSTFIADNGSHVTWALVEAAELCFHKGGSVCVVGMELAKSVKEANKPWNRAKAKSDRGVCLPLKWMLRLVLVADHVNPRFLDRIRERKEAQKSKFF